MAYSLILSLRAFLISIFVAASSGVFAQQSGEVPAAPPEKRESVEGTFAEKQAQRLDDLFAELAETEGDKVAHRRVEMEIWGEWLESGSDTIDLLMDRATRAMRESNFARALDHLDNIVRLKPDYAEGWNKRATVYFLTQDYAKSIADVQRTLELEPRHFGALVGFGRMLEDLDQEGKALEVYQEALRHNPGMDSIREKANSLEEKLGGRDI